MKLRLKFANACRPALLLALLFSNSATSQDSLFYPSWVRYPQNAVPNELSASACSKVEFMDIQTAQEDAFSFARKQIEEFIKGRRTSTESEANQPVAGISILATADVEDGESRVICVLASIGRKYIDRALQEAKEARSLSLLKEEFDQYMGDVLGGNWAGTPYLNPEKPGQFYANARALVENREYLRALDAYEKYFEFGTKPMDPYEEYHELLEGLFDPTELPALYESLLSRLPNNIHLQLQAAWSKFSNEFALNDSDYIDRREYQKNRPANLKAADAYFDANIAILEADPEFVPAMLELLALGYADGLLGSDKTLEQINQLSNIHQRLKAKVSQGGHRQYFFSPKLRKAQEDRFALYSQNHEIEFAHRTAANHFMSWPHLSDQLTELAGPIAVSCDGNGRRSAKITTASRAQQIWYSLDGENYVDTGSVSSPSFPNAADQRAARDADNYVDGRTGMKIDSPSQWLPFCGWDGDGGEEPYSLNDYTPQHNVDVNQTIWIKYQELNTQRIVGPVQVKLQAQYRTGFEPYCNPGNEKLFACNGAGCLEWTSELHTPAQPQDNACRPWKETRVDHPLCHFPDFETCTVEADKILPPYDLEQVEAAMNSLKINDYESCMNRNANGLLMKHVYHIATGTCPEDGLAKHGGFMTIQRGLEKEKEETMREARKTSTELSKIYLCLREVRDMKLIVKNRHVIEARGETIPDQLNYCQETYEDCDCRAFGIK